MIPHKQNIGLDRPGAPTLSADMQRMRLRILLSVADLNFSEAIEEIRARVQAEPAEIIRIALLAAQSWLVRERMLSMTQDIALGTVKSVLYPQESANAPQPKVTPSPKAAPIEEDGALQEEAAEGSTPELDELDDGWRRVHIISDAVVHGVRFFAGTVVEVGPIEAQKLIAARKGELLMGGVGIPPELIKSKAKTSRTPKNSAEPKTKGKASLSPVSKEEAKKIALAEAQSDAKREEEQVQITQPTPEPEPDPTAGKAVVIERSEVTNFDDFEDLPEDEGTSEPKEEDGQ